eukprot:TRINITY_DN5460_c0_g1_i1.p1 TRINITY_DN5460_c0_g1~~TRINITY_DN5460_c0_g1_i1.p1  ORF type:complete len:1122 (-),score=279.01 TRINITY_DN5460_c0_g1_i1:32-3397(-)
MIDSFLGTIRIHSEVYMVVATTTNQAGVVHGARIMRVNGVDLVSYRTGISVRTLPGGTPADIHSMPYMHLLELLNSGHFYYCTDSSKYELTATMQAQYSGTVSFSSPPWDRADNRFWWNKHLMRDVVNHQLAAWCVVLINGFVETKQCGHINGKTLDLVLVSRRARFRAGTRYNMRGIDDDGNVANFVETEQIGVIDGHILSYVQTRGSVPVFWEQQTPDLGKVEMKLSSLSKLASKVGNKIILTRPLSSTVPSFQSHFREKIARYGNIIVVNLLSSKKDGERTLIDAYEQMLKNHEKSGQVRYMYFDLHEHSKGNKYDKLEALCRQIQNDATMPPTGFFFVDPAGQVGSQQVGVVRTNCKDCLDRTNIAQSQLAFRALEAQLRLLGIMRSTSYLEDHHSVVGMFKTLWANNGDEISIQYAGSGSLKSGMTRTGEYGIRTMLEDGKKNLTRFYSNHFKDDGRQVAIDQLLGSHESVMHASSNEQALMKQLNDRTSEFMTSCPLPVFIGTFNVGGSDPGSEPLNSWLHPQANEIPAPEIYAIGIQEVVELTPGKVLNTDPYRGKIWEEEVKKCLETSGGNYTLLQSHQLVGLVLMVFAKDESVKHIRHVAYEITKTGVRGLVGNKGGIAVRLLYHNTSFCFVTAHLAAGQEGYADRNADYAEIVSQTAFGRGRHTTINTHDYVFWFGDFNYRIDLPYEEVCASVTEKNYTHLLQNDQLLRARASGESFVGFQEPPLLFDPTYKYDYNSQVYDTSAKGRIPAWTDRILYKAANPTKISSSFYRRTEILLSDHRPVSAHFVLEVQQMDKEKERELKTKIFRNKGQAAVPQAALIEFGDFSDAGSIMGDNISTSGDQVEWHDEPPLVPTPMFSNLSIENVARLDSNNGRQGGYTPPVPHQPPAHPLPSAPKQAAQPPVQKPLPNPFMPTQSAPIAVQGAQTGPIFDPFASAAPTTTSSLPPPLPPKPSSYTPPSTLSSSNPFASLPPTATIPPSTQNNMFFAGQQPLLPSSYGAAPQPSPFPVAPTRPSSTTSHFPVPPTYPQTQTPQAYNQTMFPTPPTRTSALPPTAPTAQTMDDLFGLPASAAAKPAGRPQSLPPPPVARGNRARGNSSGPTPDPFDPITKQ